MERNGPLKRGLSLWVAAVWIGVFSQAGSAFHTTRLRFPDGRSIQVDLAETPKQQEEGLMFRTRLPRDYGMLFVFSEEKKLSFWMKNTWVDLDLVFIGSSKKVTEIFQNVKRSYPESEGLFEIREGVGRYVLELPAGASQRHHLKQGDALKFSLGQD